MYPKVEKVIWISVAAIVCAATSTAAAEPICDPELQDICDVETFEDYGTSYVSHGSAFTSSQGFEFKDINGGTFFTNDGGHLGAWLGLDCYSQVMFLPNEREYVTFTFAGELPPRMQFIAVDPSGSVVDVQVHTNHAVSGGAGVQAQTVLLAAESPATISQVYFHTLKSSECDVTCGTFRLGEVRACDRGQ